MPRPLTIAALLILSFSSTATPDSGAGSDGVGIQQPLFDQSQDAKVMRQTMRKAGRDFRRNDWAAELADYNQAIAAAPNHVGGYLCRGKALLDRKEFQHAIDDFTKVIELADPNNPAGYVMRAAVWLARREYARAIADYDRAIAAADDYWIGYAGLGETLLLLGEYDRAIESLTKSIELSPLENAHEIAIRHPYDDFLYGGCPRFPPILKTGDRLFGVDDSSGTFWGDEFAYRGSAWFYKSEYDRALADIDRSTERHGYSPVANAYRGLIRLALGKCSMGFNDLKLAAHFAEVPFEQLMKNARPFVASTDCAGEEP